MRIIMLDTYPVRRGSQVFLEELAESLIAANHEVKKVYLYSYSGDVTVRLNEQDVLLNGNIGHFFEKIPTVHPSLLRKLIRAVQDFQPDFMVLNGSRTLKYAALGKRFFPKQTKLVYRIIDSVVFWNKASSTQLYYKHLIIPAMNAAVGVSRASLNDVIQLYNFTKPSTVIHRCFNAAKVDLSNTELMQKLAASKADKTVILFLGNLTQQKRPERFVATLHLLKQQYPNCCGWIVGDGVLRNEVMAQVKALQLEETITFWGYQKNVFPFIAHANVLLLTSDTEGLPGVTLESGYFKVPTVCPVVGGVKEFIVDDDHGMVLNENTPDAFCKAVSYILDNPEQATLMGENARQRVITHFDMDVITNKYLQFFKGLL